MRRCGGAEPRDTLPHMRVVAMVVGALVVSAVASLTAAGTSILFIGNSFTYGWGSPVRFYRAATVTDLNGEGIGGVPALFRVFALQAGLDYDVSLETRSGSGLDFHLENKRSVIGKQPWDIVVMHGQSTLDLGKPGDPTQLIATTRQMAEFLRAQNPKVMAYLTATWSRADQVYRGQGPWAGKPIEVMAQDVRAAYDKAAAVATGIKAVIPVGEAWSRAMHVGVADANPYDGVDAGKLNLWTYDSYHASTHGYYLEALVVFGSVTGRDPRSLGENECAAYELGLSRSDAKALQQVAYDELARSNAVTAAPLVLAKPEEPVRCPDVR
jgi:hypothetical protein